MMKKARDLTIPQMRKRIQLFDFLIFLLIAYLGILRLICTVFDLSEEAFAALEQFQKITIIPVIILTIFVVEYRRFLTKVHKEKEVQENEII